LTEEELLEAIRLAPDDPAPRQVFIDWLLERGDARGAYLRSRATDRRARPEGYKAAHEAWSRRLPCGTLDELDDDGYPTWIELTPEELAQHSARLAAAVPWLLVDLKRYAAAELLRSLPVSLAGLKLRGPTSLPELLVLPVVQGLSSLHIADLRNLPDVQAIAGAAWARLRELHLTSSAVGSPGAMALARSPALRGLRELALWYSHVGDEGAQAIAASFPKLTYLGISSCDLTEQGAQSLAALGKLETLHISNNKVGDEAMAAIVRGCPRLQVLWAGSCGLTEVPPVSALPLHRLGLGNDRIRAIGELPAGLRELYLERCPIHDEALAPLAGLGLRQLSLDDTRITGDGVSVIAGLEEMVYLRLCRTRIGNRGVKLIAASPAMGRLDELYLDGTNVTDEGAEALISSTLRLDGIFLHAAKLSPDMGARLRARFRNVRL
jgi:uncharacterized protein (TIGR02996 family)